ncbi:MAG: hypothetical protein ACO3A4_04055 [Silvanigrellaceae bacterium]
MEHLLQNTNLTRTARDFILRVVQECPNVFRPRELHWQLKLMSRYPGERALFSAAFVKKKVELEEVLPLVRLMVVPPPRSTPMSQWPGQFSGWPTPQAILTQIFLQQILISNELFLDLGSRSEAFFLSENRDFIGWVPESVGVRWHEPFRQELARLYLGWAFDQEALVETALNSMHLAPLDKELLHVLNHWREASGFVAESVQTRFLKAFAKAERVGLHLHPNTMVWAIYEIEVVEVLSKLHVVADLENSADELCRVHSRISA